MLNLLKKWARKFCIFAPFFELKRSYNPYFSKLMVYRKMGEEGLIFRDFDDVLKHPFIYVHLFLLLTLK